MMTLLDRFNDKLTRQEVEQIKKDERCQRLIGESYGVSQTAISKIKRGERWASS